MGTLMWLFQTLGDPLSVADLLRFCDPSAGGPLGGLCGALWQHIAAADLWRKRKRTSPQCADRWQRCWAGSTSGKAGVPVRGQHARRRAHGETATFGPGRMAVRQVGQTALQKIYALDSCLAVHTS